MLVGAGRMLRACAFSNGCASLKDGCVFEGSPAFPLRGMQLGYRSLSNANDAWTKEMYTDYIEDLALFGMNAVEILPDDESDKKQALMKYPVQEMNRHIAETCLRLGLEIWYWLPHKGTFMKNDAEKEAVLASAYEKFCSLPHLDHIFIPGADPGDLEPEDLFEFARLVKADAQKIHRKVKMWLSPQVFSFTPERLESFFSLLNAEPEWLDGVVFGPWERDDAFSLRKKTPERYPIRNYPDICHSFHCQYPVPEWSGHFARTHGRECINPRPEAFKRIHNRFMNCFIGSVCYSDGINDDVNKFIWLDQEWNPDTDVRDTLRDYARMFLGEEHREWFVKAALLLEESLSSGRGAEEAYALLRPHASSASLKENYRFQLAHLRCLYDMILKKRIGYDEALFSEAKNVMKKAAPENAHESILKAMEILSRADREPVMREEEDKAWECARLLNRLIGLQSSVPVFGALRWMRAAFMDGLRMPFNDRRYLERISEKALALSPEEALSLMKAAFFRDEGELYIRLSDPESMKYVISPHDAVSDPGAQNSAFIDHSAWGIGRHYQKENGEIMPLAWESGIATLFDVPLRLRFDNPGKSACEITVTYFFNKASPRIYLDVNGHIFENYRAFAIDDRVHTYRIGSALMQDGAIDLTLRALEGTVGPGISEISIKYIKE